jgi:dTDP-4-amino-4,6-dideoxygalactose transaminase
MDSQVFASERLPLFFPSFRVDESLEAIRECLERGWTGAGFKTLEFEADWRAYTGLSFAHFVNSCTAALHTAIAVLKRREKWQDRDEIIVPPNTFISTARAVTYEIMTPVFADVDEYLCLDPADMLAKITPRTRAVIFVGIAGSTGQLEAVRSICRERGLTLILDAAHLAGAKLRNRDAGHFADVSCYSFHAVKNVPTRRRHGLLW